MSRIDRRVSKLLAESAAPLGEDATSPDPAALHVGDSQAGAKDERTAERPPTVNPNAADLRFETINEAVEVIERLRSYSKGDEGALKLDLPSALVQATAYSREFTFAEEEYVLAALRLLIERHLWGPRFFDEMSAVAVGEGSDGLYDTSLRLVNEFRVTQRLPYGGEVSARALARATEDLHEEVAGEESSSAEVILAANIPLLRGAGTIAREDRIQAERDLVYAARDFEQFRRDFLFSITQDFLDLVVQQQSVTNAQRQVEQLREVEARERSLYEAGRTPLFQAALAEQSTVAALDSLNNRLEAYLLAVDRFKVQLGMAIDQPVEIVPSSLELPIPDASLELAVQAGMAYRLDLQTRRDVVDDARRGLDNARNQLLPDLNVIGSVSIPSDESKTKAGLELDGGDTDWQAGITFGLPLDREIERLRVRTAQIDLERQLRDYEEFRDTVAVTIRGSVRDIDRARYALQIQERNIQIGEDRVASIQAAPDRATARDASDASNELLVAKDARDSAKRDLEVAILRYLLETGQLRVDAQGLIRPLQGMTLGRP